MLTDNDYEQMEEARKLYEDIFDSDMSINILERLAEEGNPLESILFTVFHDAVQQGYIVDLPGIVSENGGDPMYMASATHLRTLLYTGLTIGMFYQSNTDKLEAMWKVDKSPDSE